MHSSVLRIAILASASLFSLVQAAPKPDQPYARAGLLQARYPQQIVQCSSGYDCQAKCGVINGEMYHADCAAEGYCMCVKGFLSCSEYAMDNSQCACGSWVKGKAEQCGGNCNTCPE